MKAAANISNRARREIFVLTAGEKKIVAFVLSALILGLTTKHYREKEIALQRKSQIETASPAPGEKKRSPRPKRSPIPN